MARINWLLRLIFLLALSAAVSLATRSQAADEPLFGGGVGGDGELDVSASFTKAEGKKPAQLTITADIPDGWHIYSLTQRSGGPLPTRIKFKPPLAKNGDVTENAEFILKGDFKPDPAPDVHTDPAAYGNLPLEEHRGHVTWKAPIEFKPGVDPAKLEIHGVVNSQRCSDSCLPPKDFPFVAKLAAAEKKPADKTPPPGGEPKSPAKPAAGAGSGVYKAEGSHVVIHGALTPVVVAPGGTAQLVMTAEPDPDWHIYALAARGPVTGVKPTLIALTDSSHLRYTPLATPSAKPIEVPDASEGTLRYYDAPVTWTIFIEIPKTAAAGDYPIEGLIGYQTCTSLQCYQPLGAAFRGTLQVGGEETPGVVPLDFQASSYTQAAKAAEEVVKANPQLAAAGTSVPNADEATAATAKAAKPQNPSDAKDTSLDLGVAIAFGLLGGFILNFMPCVLPVIGLKLLSFLEQGGKSRGHVFALNLCYTGGILAVFMVLATLAAFAGFAWGERSTSFNIGLTCVVFVMALSFLGVWEIPIPGFVGSGKSVELAAKEGAAGAFAKGILTTVLATPCSGPFLGPVFGYLLKQPPHIVYLIFGMIGVGMSLPYLVIGAFPRLIRFLPKPGAWMETFKQIMGFVLLGTVVFLFSTLSDAYFLPTLTLLFGLWAGCWWIGRTPLFAPLGKRLAAWTGAGMIAAAVGGFAFTILLPGPSALEWQPFTAGRLQQLTHEGKTVLVDFTANWCLTCKVNLRFAINTQDVKKLVKSNDVVPLVADWTDYGPEIKEALDAIHSNSLPVLAIFPADRPNSPIILRDAVSKQQVLDALEQAGPSRARRNPTVKDESVLPPPVEAAKNSSQRSAAAKSAEPSPATAALR